jgi:mRNA interferase YafQ
MRKLQHGRQLSDDLRRVLRRGADLQAFREAVDMLVEEQELPESYSDHSLEGQWGGYQEFHIEPDWLLIYKVDAKTGVVSIVRTGTHEDLFG